MVRWHWAKCPKTNLRRPGSQRPLAVALGVDFSAGVRHPPSHVLVCPADAVLSPLPAIRAGVPREQARLVLALHQQVLVLHRQLGKRPSLIPPNGSLSCSPACCWARRSSEKQC